MERREEKERVLVPVRRIEAAPKRELPEQLPEPQEVKVTEVPRRWRTY